MRVILGESINDVAESRITPACAGNTLGCFWIIVHPLGSPPHVRVIQKHNFEDGKKIIENNKEKRLTLYLIKGIISI